ncbi:N(2)-acetyl-L-2,4-diaminobutanoate deacetylase DoeB [uncultured Cocleimonas sp.]|uniref:N(2)-acetyl-L-2,4-diaminobutanoate deacetylase DoeB n=1 Tax=uncultured Cocleimonas sp. TaxID=1051587 RepID=UPI0026019B48|nr:N(2)-acetyl-L-2,4-diaminobutanoate deacetylase DoeB [uncultured Cocleimonas sp.]
MNKNPITATIDFEKDGIQHGFLRLPHSTNESAWGSIMIPITQIKNGSGPTALLNGGNHGDEYEGPIALYNLAARNKYDDVQGRIIIVPAMNYPAFVQGTRVSPIDGLNMNRIYPGKAKSTVTNVIADYFSRTLVPMADYVLDIHSGGKTLDFVPFAASHELENKEQEAKCSAAMKAFGAPYDLKMVEIDAAGLYDTQVESMGKVFVTTELGGGGTTSPETNAIAKRGVHNFLRHAGILEGEVTPPLSGAFSLDMSGDDCFLFSEHNGVLEPFINLGDHVKKGQLMARVHEIERTAAPTHVYLAPSDGIVISRHFPTRIKMGDCINVIAQVI